MCIFIIKTKWRMQHAEIALFTDDIVHLHYNEIELVLGNFGQK